VESPSGRWRPPRKRV